jgi:ABC-type glycerol-3-phosphate transport system permease component
MRSIVPIARHRIHLWHLFLVPFSLVWIYPFVWVVSSAFKSQREMLLGSPTPGVPASPKATRSGTWRNAGQHCVPVDPAASLGGAGPGSCGRAARRGNVPAFEYSPATVAFANSLLAEPIVASHDGYQLPDGPGLGVVVDEDKVRALAA